MKSKIERKILKTITSAPKSKKAKHFPWAINSTCLKHSFRTFFRIFVREANSEMIYTVTARLHKLILAVHSICKKKRIFHNFYLRLKSAEAFTTNNALLSSNSTNSLLKSVRKTSAFKFQLHWMILSHEAERIYSFHNANPQLFQNNRPPQ